MKKFRARGIPRWWVLIGGVFLLLPTGCSGAPKLIPTPNLYLDSLENPFADVPAALQSNRVDVLYVTDRRPVQDKGTLAYDYGRSASLSFGSAVVQLGDEVSWDELVKASQSRKRDVSLPVSLVELVETDRFPATPLPYDPQDDFTGTEIRYDPQVLAEQERVTEAFRAELRARLELTPRKDVLVFIHGYNTSFEKAVRIVAEIWHFLPRQGVPIAYSWPAGLGGLRGYFYDRESGEFTIYHLKEFLRLLLRTPEIDKVHLIAHSRGTDVLMTALRELLIELGGRDYDPGPNSKLGNVIVAAPDIDVDVISQRIAAEELGTKIDRLTVYMSRHDAAIGLSTWLFVSRKRIGRATQEDFSTGALRRTQSPRQAGVAFIDAQVDGGLVGHDYFYSHPAALSDLILVLRDGRDPGKENGRPLVKNHERFWTLREDYPSSDPAE